METIVSEPTPEREIPVISQSITQSARRRLNHGSTRTRGERKPAVITGTLSERMGTKERKGSRFRERRAKV